MTLKRASITESEEPLIKKIKSKVDKQELPYISLDYTGVSPDIQKELDNKDLESNSKKSILHKDIIERWEKSQYNMIAHASVGLGKTRIMALSILHIIEKFEGFLDNNNILIITNSTLLRDVDTPKELNNWLNILTEDKDLLEKIKSSIKYECYKTVYKWKKKSFGLVLSDEIDFIGDNYVKFYKENTYKFHLGLTGTMTEEKESLLLSISPINYRYSVGKAIENNVVNKVEIIIHEVELNPKETEDYMNISAKLKNIDMQISYYYDKLRGSRNPEVVEKIEKLKQDKSWHIFGYGNKKSRTHIIHNFSSTINYAIRLKDRIINKDPSSKIIFFAYNTELAEKMSVYSFHGKQQIFDNLIEQFNEGIINNLSVCKKANRGINFHKLNHSIVQSYVSSETNFIQGFLGRLTRLDSKYTAYCHILNPYYRDKHTEQKVYTQANNWIKMFLQDIGSSVSIKYYNEKGH